MPTLSIAELTDLSVRALRRAGASESMARATADALIAAEAWALSGHGIARLPLYCAHLKQGRARGDARPSVVQARGGCSLIDADGGLAYPAMALAVDRLIGSCREHGVAFVGVTNSHHCGAMGYHLEPIAAAGLVGFGFTNSPAAMNAWGGRRPLLGTNPIAACFPRAGKPALVIDLSLTEVARGKIMLHAEQGKPIPVGWALDRDGRPTTDPKAALTGSMAPMGGAKGAMLAVMVELICCALTGAAFGFENDSFFEPGRPARIGHALLALDPRALAGESVYAERIETLIAAMLADDGVRLPGSRRVDAFSKAQAEGITLSEGLHEQLARLAA